MAIIAATVEIAHLLFENALCMALKRLSARHGPRWAGAGGRGQDAMVGSILRFGAPWQGL
jgi:hypothetical protein